jgi:hypothetical protein
MPKTPVRVFWRGADGKECVLRSTDQGWEVAVVAEDGQPVKKERVSGSRNARMIADRWRPSDKPPST